MSKYTEQFKLEVVNAYLTGPGGCKAIAKSYGIRHSQVLGWTAAYRAHGLAGLRMKQSAHYDTQFKLKVLKYMWDNALAYTQAASVFDVRNPSHLRKWERRYHDGTLGIRSPRSQIESNEMPTTKPDFPEQPPLAKTDENRTHDELVAEVNYLRMEVAYLKKLRALVQSERAKAQRGKRKSSKN